MNYFQNLPSNWLSLHRTRIPSTLQTNIKPKQKQSTELSRMKVISASQNPRKKTGEKGWKGCCTITIYELVAAYSKVTTSSSIVASVRAPAPMQFSLPKSKSVVVDSREEVLCFCSVSLHNSYWLTVSGCLSYWFHTACNYICLCCYWWWCCAASKNSHISKSKVKSVDEKEEKLEKSKNRKSSRKNPTTKTQKNQQQKLL